MSALQVVVLALALVAAALPAVRRGRQAAEGLRARGGVARDPADEELDERFSALAKYLLAGHLYECPWEAFRLSHFKGMEDEPAALALAAWAWRNQTHIMFKVRRVGEHDVLYVLLRDKRQ